MDLIQKFGISELSASFEKQLGLKSKIKWNILINISLFHFITFICAYLYAFPVKWQTLLFVFFMYTIASLGIAAGSHRFWTHRSYKARLPLRIFLMLAYSSIGQITIYKWVRDHRVHHKFSDTAADPHDSSRGFWFSHIGWLCMKKNPLVIEKGKLIDMSDIEQDPVVMFEKRHSGWLSLMVGFILPTLAAILLWGETWKCAVTWLCFIRVLAVCHAEGTVNSFAHMYGYRPYNKFIKPRDNFFVSLVTLGNGGHNYHHMFPYDYKSAETFDYFELTSLFIDIMAKMGLAYDLKRPSPKMVQAALEKQKTIGNNEY